MLEVTNISVSSYFFDRIEVSWEISDTSEDVHDYTFTLARSESEGGPWDTLADGLEDRYAFTDTSVDLRNFHRNYYYRIGVVRKSDSETAWSKASTRAPRVSLYAAEVRRREAVYFRKVVGRKALWFPRRTFGQRCRCWHPIQGIKLKGHCRECFGTGYVKGYLNPIEIWIQFDPSTKSNEMLPDVETQQVMTVARVPGYFAIKPKDVVVEEENRRWRVVHAIPTERLRATLHNTFRLSEITPTEIEFSLPVTAFSGTDEYHFHRRMTI